MFTKSKEEAEEMVHSFFAFSSAKKFANHIDELANQANPLKTNNKLVQWDGGGWVNSKRNELVECLNY